MQVSGDSMSPSIKNNSFILLKKIRGNAKLSRGDIIVINLFFEKDANNRLINEPYTISKGKTGFYWELGEKEYIVLGDNRKNTLDSRNFGKIKSKNVFWKVILSLKPLKKVKKQKYF
jgi:signal peptidase I